MIGKGHPFTSSDTLLLSEIPGRMVLTPGDCGLNNNMPVVRPRGHFPSIIIKPNESVDYKLIIKKPR
ncbi:MAG: hypothetical protein JXA72_00265 [Bacteroidales bacterium]|nr:hypothetical protein [Bacteroidales bacterium]